MLPELEEELLVLEEKLEKAVDHLSAEYVTVRAGRANPKILDNIVVDYYGSPTPLKQMANITVPEARMLVINLFDKSATKEVDALQEELDNYNKEYEELMEMLSLYDQ